MCATVHDSKGNIIDSFDNVDEALRMTLLNMFEDAGWASDVLTFRFDERPIGTLIPKTVRGSHSGSFVYASINSTKTTEYWVRYEIDEKATYIDGVRHSW